jgi:hypothetical protein
MEAGGQPWLAGDSTADGSGRKHLESTSRTILRFEEDDAKPGEHPREDGDPLQNLLLSVVLHHSIAAYIYRKTRSPR